MAIKFLNVEKVLDIHKSQIEHFGGSKGLKDLSLLKSAMKSVKEVSVGKGNTENLYEIASSYIFHIVKNSPFVDGNKRVGLHSALVFLYLNGIKVETEDELLVELLKNSI
ncbi:MAG: type II toxin-antitoxin system death-on-curing family toxin [bacterium]